MGLFRMLYRVAAVIGITVILVKYFDVPFSLWWFIPLALVTWIVTQMRARYVELMLATKVDASEEKPFVDLEKDRDGSWKSPVKDD